MCTFDPTNFTVVLFSMTQKATKWSERRDAVAELTKLASVKKIANGDFSEVSRILKKVSMSCYWPIVEHFTRKVKLTKSDIRDMFSFRLLVFFIAFCEGYMR